MGKIEDEVREEVERVHDFFVEWFNGTAAKGELETMLIPRLDKEMFYLTPDGTEFTHDDLIGMFRETHETNPEFRIDIRDVRILREYGDHLLVTYTEWQKGARSSNKPDNARMTTLLLRKGEPFQWLHVHETWLPETVRAAGLFNF